MAKGSITHVVKKGLAVLMLFAAYKASGTTWSVYKNPRYGFEVAVPENFKNSTPIQDEDGREFVTEDGGATIKAYGEIDEHVYGSELYLEKVISAKSPAVDEEILNIEINGYSLILRSRRGDKIFYENILFTCKDKVINKMTLIYDAEKADIYQPLEEKLNRRFSGGLGSRTPLCN